MERQDVFGEIAALQPLQIWDGVVAWAVHGERVTFSLLELEPGAMVPEHSHENEQVGTLVSGSVTFRIGEEWRELDRGATWRIGANTPHELTTGREGAVVVEVFAPPRADWESLERLEPRRPPWPRP